MLLFIAMNAYLVSCLMFLFLTLALSIPIIIDIHKGKIKKFKDIFKDDDNLFIFITFLLAFIFSLLHIYF